LKRLPPFLRRSFLSPAFWFWLALSAFPPELLSHAFGWGLADPAYLASSLLWWPADTLGRLAALRILLEEFDRDARSGPGVLRPSSAALGPALAAEILLSLRSAVLALLGIIPCLALYSLLEPAQTLGWAWRLLLGALALGGLLPALFYVLKRMLAPLELLRRPLRAGEALDASAARLKGRLKAFVRMALPWLLLSWALDLGGLALPDWVALGLALPSLAAQLAPIALSQGLL
jgi:hypothetical protein